MFYRLIRKIPKSLYWGFSFLYRTIKNFFNAHGIILSNSLAFSLILSFVPFVVAIAILSSKLPLSSDIVRNIEYFYFNKFIPQSGQAVYSQFKFSFANSHQLSWLGTISLVISSYSMMFTTEQHINMMFRITKSRKFWKLILNHSLILICGFLLIYQFGLLSNLVEQYISGQDLRYFINMSFAHCFTAFVFFCCYKFMPKRKINWKNALICTVLATTSFIFVQGYFILSIQHFRNEYYLLYGSLVMLPIFLLWVYCEVFIILFFAQMLHSLESPNFRTKFVK